MSKRDQVFVSYSHADSDHLQRLKVHLRPFERRSQVDLWADTRIRTGDRWRQEITAALDRAAVAVLLVSADFLASEFIARNELPPLLRAANEEGVKILPVILKSCAFTSMDELADYQAINDPMSPLISLDENESEALWAKLAETIQAEIQQFSQALGAEEIDPTPLFSGLDWAVTILRSEITDPNCLDDYIVYRYEHIDVPELMPTANALLQEVPNREDILNAVRNRLSSGGWEGDGDIRIMWFPPFTGAGIEDTWGTAVWHVKQYNNGMSFLASPVPLPFPRLLEQQF